MRTHRVGNVRKKNGNARRKIKEWLEKTCDTCWICTLGINQAYSYPHAYCMVADELIPVSRGGSPYARDNVRAAHNICNAWRSNKDVAHVRAIQQLIFSFYHINVQTPKDFVAIAQGIEQKSKKRQNARKYSYGTSTAW